MTCFNDAYICNYSKVRSNMANYYKVEVITNHIGDELTVLDLKEIHKMLKEAEQYFSGRLEALKEDSR